MIVANHRLKTFIALILCVFVLDATAQNWYQVGSDIDGEALGDFSGTAVSMSSDGTIIAIGAQYNNDAGNDAGHARVYELVGNTWIQKGNDIDGAAPLDRFGEELSLSSDGTTLAIASEYNDDAGQDAGHVRVFEWSGNSWVQKGADIDGFLAEGFARAVSINGNGNIVAVGAPLYDSLANTGGAVRVFEWDGAAWNQMGSTLASGSFHNRFGTSVCLDGVGHTLIVGATEEDGGWSNDPGRAAIIRWDGTSWSTEAVFIGEGFDDEFGTWVTMNDSGTVAAVGAPNNDGGPGSNTGHVRVFEWDGTSWAQKGPDIDGALHEDRSGRAIDLSADGNIVAIGASGHDPDGHVRLFEWNGVFWDQIGTDLDGEADGGFAGTAGSAVSISADGKVVAIGDTQANAGPKGQVQVFEWLTCTPNTGVHSITACDSLTWIDGLTYTADNSTATHTLINATGCDSVVTLSLIINDCSGSNGCHNLFFSEYIEGSSNNKALELYNPTPTAIDLSNYTINKYNNGAATPTESETLSGMLQAGTSYVIAHAQADSDIQNVADHVSTITFFNGDDALELVHGSTPIDVIGEIGTDPGSSWTVGSGSTKEHTLVRNSAITEGQLDWADGAGEWDAYGQNEFSYLGAHDMVSCCPTASSSEIYPSACESYTAPSGTQVWDASGVYTDVIGNSTGCDSVITIYLTIQSSATTDVINACEPITWQNGNTYNADNNTATYTLTNAAGCDSVITLDLTITEPDITVQLWGSTLTSAASNATWQWLDCDNALAPIVGATQSDFTPEVNGNYAVEVTQNGCSDMSPCYAVNNVGISQRKFAERLSLYPNPTSGPLTITLPQGQENLLLRLTDVSGKVVRSETHFAGQQAHLQLECPPGLYLLYVVAPSGASAVAKVVKTAHIQPGR